MKSEFRRSFAATWQVSEKKTNGDSKIFFYSSILIKIKKKYLVFFDHSMDRKRGLFFIFTCSSVTEALFRICPKVQTNMLLFFFLRWFFFCCCAVRMFGRKIPPRPLRRKMRQPWWSEMRRSTWRCWINARTITAPPLKATLCSLYGGS